MIYYLSLRISHRKTLTINLTPFTSYRTINLDCIWSYFITRSSPIKVSLKTLERPTTYGPRCTSSPGQAAFAISVPPMPRHNILTLHHRNNLPPPDTVRQYENHRDTAYHCSRQTTIYKTQLQFSHRRDKPAFIRFAFVHLLHQCCIRYPCFEPGPDRCVYLRPWLERGGFSPRGWSCPVLLCLAASSMRQGFFLRPCTLSRRGIPVKEKETPGHCARLQPRKIQIAAGVEHIRVLCARRSSLCCQGPVAGAWINYQRETMHKVCTVVFAHEIVGESFFPAPSS